MTMRKTIKNIKKKKQKIFTLNFCGSCIIIIVSVAINKANIIVFKMIIILVTTICLMMLRRNKILKI